MPESWHPLLVFVLGAMVGSFLNVCIYRMPRKESVIWPGSHCGRCKLPVRAYDNIPVFSYLILRGKCRFCKHKIPARYLMVEVLTAAIWLFLWQRYGLSPFFWAGIVLFSILIAITFIDFETELIPDRLSLTGLAAGLGLSAAWPVLHGKTVWYEGLGEAGIGIAAGGGLLLAIGMAGNLILKKESMGGGDVKLLAMIGSFIGWQKAVYSFFLSPFLALPFALYVTRKKKKANAPDKHVPYGPFLAISGALFYLYGNQLINALLRLYGLE